jgi:hypothetical protein
MRVVDGVLVVVAVVGCSRPEKPNEIPAGAYTTEMAPSDVPANLSSAQTDSMTGTWTLHFSPGNLAVDFKRSRVVDAPIRVVGNRVTFDSTDSGPAACHLPATYTYTVERGTARFSKVTDQCDGRAAVLTSHPLRRQSP